MKRVRGSTSLQERLQTFFSVVTAVTAVVGAILLLLEYGFNLSTEIIESFYLLNYLIAAIIVILFFLKFIFHPQKKQFISSNYKDLILISVFGIFLLFLRAHILFPEIFEFLKDVHRTLPFSASVILCQVFIVMFLILRIPQLHSLFLSFRLSPSLTVIATFLIIAGVGTLLLLLPVSTAPERTTSPVDALFTATSATCVTGLIVVDTGTHFSAVGQLIILLILQIGGLGLMTFTSFFALLAGELGLRDRVILRDMVKYTNLGKIGHLVASILFLTFLFEATGAILLYFQLLPTTANKLSAAYSAIFHSISAFCNAGFSIYSDSFISYRGDIEINLIMTSLIICGGLGFAVIVNLLQAAVAAIKKRGHYLSLHSKMVLTTTGVLIVLGTLLIFLGEKDNLLKNLPFGQQLMASYFQSVTARTAGFNTLPIHGVTFSSAFLLIMLMFIGASPGSTGGGIKTSTFAALLFTIKSIAQGKSRVEAFKRTIPQTLVYQALCVVILALGWVGFSTLFLSFTEDAPFLKIFFEVFSALGTVGLSRGLTPNLTTWGKIIIIITMLAGRIGPLTLALGIAERRKVTRYEYPEEGVIIG